MKNNRISEKVLLLNLNSLSIIFVLLICSCSKVQDQKTVFTESIATKSQTFFVSVPILGYSDGEIPYLNVEIEDQNLPVELDLGFQGHLAITRDSVNSISSKMFIGEKLMYGIRSKQYKKQLYRIPKVKIGAMAFSPPILHEENEEFLTDAKFLQNKEDSFVKKEVGRVGWELFCSTNLVIDLKNSRIAFCDSLDTLKKEGFTTETFIKTPLFLERGFVEIIATSPNGPLRCVLDTGSTWNVLNEESLEGKPIDTMAWEPENVLEYPFFKVEDTDMGHMIFHQMFIKIPIHVEAILGMEFFKDHLVFLDFRKKMAYISKAH